MKKILTFLFIVSFCSVKGQRLTPDVELLSDIITQKQEELKRRVLNNLVVSNIRTTNYTTYNSVYNLVKIITTEKNKTVITKRLIAEIVDYTVVMAVSKDFNNNFLKSQFNIHDERKNNLYNLISADTANSLNRNIESSQKYLNEREKKDRSKHQLNDNTKGSWGSSSLFYLTKEIDKTNTGKMAPKKSSVTIDKSIYANYIIDEISSRLRKKPKLIDLGIFSNNIDRSRFNTGLKIDTTKIDPAFKKKIASEIDSYLIEIADSLKIKELVPLQLFLKGPSKINDFTHLSSKRLGNLISLFSETLDHFRGEVGRKK